MGGILPRGGGVANRVLGFCTKASSNNVPRTRRPTRMPRKLPVEMDRGGTQRGVCGSALLRLLLFILVLICVPVSSYGRDDKREGNCDGVTYTHSSPCASPKVLLFNPTTLPLDVGTCPTPRFRRRPCCHHPDYLSGHICPTASSAGWYQCCFVFQELNFIGAGGSFNCSLQHACVHVWEQDKQNSVGIRRLHRIILRTCIFVTHPMERKLDLRKIVIDLCIVYPIDRSL